MNILICHGYGHRLLNNNVLESAPVEDTHNPHEQPGTFIADSDWSERTAESMDLSGGDIELIRNTLSQMSFVFASDEPRLPRSVQMATQIAGAMEPK